MKKTCYNCGGPADTKDHIPPKIIFPKGCGKNLITVPSCCKCNHAMSLNDQYFGAILSTAVTRSGASLDVWNQKVQPQLRRKGYEGLLKNLQATSHRVSIPFGDTIIETFVVEGDSGRLDSVLVKVVRGLFYYHHGRPLAKSSSVQIYWNPEFPLV